MKDPQGRAGKSGAGAGGMPGRKRHVAYAAGRSRFLRGGERHRGFAYGILRGVHAGLLDQKWESVARKALRPILSLISEDGVVNQVSYGTPMGRISRDFYKTIPIQPMPYGQALAILFLIESGVENDK